MEHLRSDIGVRLGRLLPRVDGGDPRVARQLGQHHVHRPHRPRHLGWKAFIQCALSLQCSLPEMYRVGHLIRDLGFHDLSSNIFSCLVGLVKDANIKM